MLQFAGFSPNDILRFFPRFQVCNENSMAWRPLDEEEKGPFLD